MLLDNFFIFFPEGYDLKRLVTGAGKQNLETIVEAIRHLEGDHLFSEESGPHQV